MANNNDEYRNKLQLLEQESQSSYDKTVITLSSGALAISFVFVNDIVGESQIVCHAALLTSWVLWGSSVTSILFSYFFSHLAIRKAINQIDNNQSPYSCLDKITAFLNAVGGVLFLAGVVSIIVFANKNM